MATILVIDDDPAVLAVIAEVLSDEGYVVHTAANGAEGLTVVAQERPGMVLLDMRMPVMNGWEFARALAERGLRLPVVVISAAQDAERWAREIGAYGTLPKPFDLDALLSVVARIVHDTL